MEDINVGKLVLELIAIIVIFDAILLAGIMVVIVLGGGEGITHIPFWDTQIKFIFGLIR